MFFFLNWGSKWKYNIKEGGLRVEKLCPECTTRGIFFEVVPTKYFSIFWISVAPTETKKSLLQCPNCHERFYIQQSDYLSAIKGVAKPKINADRVIHLSNGHDFYIVPCDYCGKRLKVPNNNKMLRVTCPSCKNTFNFQKGEKVLEATPIGSHVRLESSKIIWWQKHLYSIIGTAVLLGTAILFLVLHEYKPQIKSHSVAPPAPTQTSIPSAPKVTNLKPPTEKPQTNSFPFPVTPVPKLLSFEASKMSYALYFLHFQDKKDMRPEYELAYKLDKKARKYYEAGKYNLAAETFKLAAEKFIDKESLSDEGKTCVKENRILSYKNASWSYEMINDMENIKIINKEIGDNLNKFTPIEPIEPKNPKRLPNGSSPFGPGIRSGHSTLTVDNGTDTDAVVRVIRFMDSEQKVRNFYIHNGKKWTEKGLPPGQYVIRVAFGRDWNSKSRKFNFRKSFSETEVFELTEKTSVRETDEGQLSETHFKKMSITLHKVPLGNFKSHEINEEAFDR